MKKSGKITLRFVILLLGLTTLGGFFLRGEEKTASAENDAGETARQPVQIAAVRQADVPVLLQAPGNIVSEATVNITSRVDGQLTAIYFTEGEEVKKGQLLAQIDPREYEAALQRYQGELAENRAMLKSAGEQLKRYKTLQQQHLIARQDLDNQAATVEQLQGAITASQGQIAAAQLKLAFTRITAPVSGRAGLRLIDEGNMIIASENKAIVTLTQEQPVAVTFSLPQENLFAVRAKQQRSRLPVALFDADNRQTLAHCQLRYISNEIDSATGSIKLKAVCDNENRALYPSQLVNAHLQLDLLKNVVVLPQRAIQYSHQGNFVYAVDAGRVVQREVTTGAPYGQDDVVLKSGLRPGEKVVTEGFADLHNGSAVDIVDASAGKEAVP
ncbi:efflux RND transporter periplasmic adaptor subunit [Erwinia sp. CGal63]|uniref:efflux RND transporter periplasmic adaptor subunit n=1 Tax=Erwinia sp. CGal63 TaxID=2919889 RepID=UPI003009BBD9